MINQTRRLFSPRQFRVDLIDENLKESDIVVRPTYLSICVWNSFDHRFRGYF